MRNAKCIDVSFMLFKDILMKVTHKNTYVYITFYSKNWQIRSLPLYQEAHESKQISMSSNDAHEFWRHLLITHIILNILKSRPVNIQFNVVFGSFMQASLFARKSNFLASYIKVIIIPL